jgi:hypothetical protein
MGLMDTRKPGLSNGVAKQEGYPTSGEMSANAGALPAQRAQAPYEQNRAQTNMPEPTAKPPVGGGTLNGGAVQGAQYKTQAQNMSPGVASFVSIPKGISAQPAGFTAPQPSVPGATKMQQQPQYFAAPQPSAQPQQQQQAAPASPAQANPPMPTAAPGQGAIPNQYQPEQDTTYANQPTTNTANTANSGTTSPSPAPTADAANYDYLAEMQKMGQMYDVGGQYDLNQRSIEAEKARQQNMAAWAQNQLTGRGGTAAQAQQNYMNTMAALQADTARAQLAQGAHQTELGNRLAFNKQVADEKTRLVELADKLGFHLDEKDFNKIAYENTNAYQGGKPISDIDSIKAMRDVAEGKGSVKVDNYVDQIREILRKNNWNSEQDLVGVFTKMTPEEAKAFYNSSQGNRGLLNAALAATWGSDNEKIRAVFYKTGIYNLGY